MLQVNEEAYQIALDVAKERDRQRAILKKMETCVSNNICPVCGKTLKKIFKGNWFGTLCTGHKYDWCHECNNCGFNEGKDMKKHRDDYNHKCRF